MDCSTPGFPVLHHLLEFAHTHVHSVDEAIQPSHPLSSPFPLAFNFSQHQGLFQWVGSSHQVAKVFSFSFSPSNEYSGLISFRKICLHLISKFSHVILPQNHIPNSLYFWGAPKSLQMVTAAMKLKCACSLEGKLWQTDHILKSRDITLATKVHIVKPQICKWCHPNGFSSGHVWT